MGSSPIARSKQTQAPEREPWVSFFEKEGREPGKGIGETAVSPAAQRGAAGGSSLREAEPVRRPIARSKQTQAPEREPWVFFFLVFLMGALSAGPLAAQVETDPARPFGQGLVVPLPATSAFAGDLPHSLLLGEEAEDPLSLGGWISTRVLSFGPAGKAPGLLMDGIAYPFPIPKPLDWFPFFPGTRYLDFPAAAWWGSEAAGGAVQVRPQDPEEGTGHYSIWGGSGLALGTRGWYGAGPLGLQWDLEKIGTGPGDGPSLAAALVSLKLLRDERLDWNGTALASRLDQGNDWSYLSTKIRWTLLDFQTLEFRPFLQTAAQDGARITEWGATADYHLNMGGFAEGRLGGGYRRGREDLAALEWDRGFLAASFLADVLGMANLDASFREDLAEQASFHYLIGIQGAQEPFTWIGDIGKAPPRDLGGDLDRTSLGFRYQPSESLSATCRFLYQWGASGEAPGAWASLQWRKEGNILGFLRKVRLELEGLATFPGQGPGSQGAGGSLGLSLSRRDLLWVRVKWERDQGPLWMGGSDLSLAEPLVLYLEAENIGGQALSWPEALRTQGRTFRAGLKGEL